MQLTNSLTQKQQVDVVLKMGKPENFTCKNPRSWLKSIREIFVHHTIATREQQKIKFAVSYAV